MSLFQREVTRESEFTSLRKAVREAPEDPSPRNRLGDWYSLHGNLKEAIREFRRTAEIHLHRGNYPKAMAILKKAFQLAPLDVPLADQLVHACRLANRPQTAADVFFSMSLRLSAERDQKGAYQMFSRGVAENPGNMQRKRRLADWSLKLGKNDRSADLLLEMAEFWGQKLDLERAYKVLAEAREIRNGPKAALVEIRILTLSGRHGEAQNLAEKTMRRFPNHAGLQAWQRNHRTEPAFQYYPSKVPAEAVLSRLRHTLLQARSWLSQGYPARAVGLIHRMLLLDPGFLPALDLAEQIHRDSGYLSRFQRLCLSCAQRLTLVGRREEALACIDRVEAIFPGSGIAYRASMGLPSGDQATAPIAPGTTSSHQTPPLSAK